MKIETKLSYLKTYIDSIATHDDASMDEVDAALSEAGRYIEQGRADAIARRAAAEAATAVASTEPVQG